jgi:anti-sigma B factor antagonist
MESGPPPAELEVTVSNSETEMVVHAAGEVDLLTASRLGDALESAQAGGGAVLLDLRDVEFMDSTGLRLLLQARERAQRSGGALRLAVEREGPVWRLLALVNVLELFDVGGGAADG